MVQSLTNGKGRGKKDRKYIKFADWLICRIWKLILFKADKANKNTIRIFNNKKVNAKKANSIG